MSLFSKEYTRDTTLIIQQAWYASLEHHRDLLGLSAYRDKILTIHYLHNDVIEIWENLAWKQSLLDTILEKNREGDEWFKKYTALHVEGERILLPHWERGYTDDVDVLKRVVEHVFDTMYYFDWMYYPTLDDRTPKEIRAAADVLRVRDNYFDATDRFFRSSLVRMYPQLAGYEQAILRSEISSPPAIEILKTRCANFVVVGEHEAKVESLEEFIKAHPEVERAEESMPGISELRGQVGSKGKAIGRVRIMLKKSQIVDAQEGEVLVAAMTTPDFVPAMKKAAAIVTDEGGIMCHAAIVARELKKPCVIGTRFATQVFKDGDMVEVDAEKGTVRKVEK